jgi:hypothetical protein
LNILSGIRIEETRFSGAGNVRELTPEEAARRAEWAGDVTPEETRRRMRAEFGQRSGRGEYRRVFPGIHFRYEISPRMIGRASHSTGIGRPNFGHIVSRDSVDHVARSVVASQRFL